MGRGPSTGDAEVRGAGTVAVGEVGRAAAFDVHEAVDALAGPMAIQTPQARQNARLGGLGVPQSQHSTDGEELSRAIVGPSAARPAAPFTEDEERGTGEVAGLAGEWTVTAPGDGATPATVGSVPATVVSVPATVGSVPAPDATASVGRGRATGVTRESHSLQKMASGWTGVPHMGQADGVSTRALCGPLLCGCNRQSCVAGKYWPRGRTDGWPGGPRVIATLGGAPSLPAAARAGDTGQQVRGADGAHGVDDPETVAIAATVPAMKTSAAATDAAPTDAALPSSTRVSLEPGI
jgi:hypothetical protein